MRVEIIVFILGFLSFSNSILTLYTNDTDFLEIISNPDNNNLTSVWWGFGEKRSIDYSRIVAADPLFGCKLENEDEVRGNIVYFQSGGCYPQEKMRSAQKAGAIAVVISAYEVLGATPYYWNGEKNDDILIPAFEVDYVVAFNVLDFINSSMAVYATITPDDNPKAGQFSKLNLGFFSFVFLATNLFSIGFSFYKLYLFIKYDGFRFTVPVVTLLLSVVAATLRVAFSIDPQGVFHIRPHVGYNVLITYNFPWTLSSSLVISVYWHRAWVSARQNMDIDAPAGRGSFTQNIILALIATFCVFLITLETTTLTLRTLWRSPYQLVIVSGFTYLFTSFIVAVYFLITGFLLLKKLNSVKDEKSKRLTRFIIVDAIGLLMLSGAACVAATPWYIYGPGAFTVVDWVSYAGVTIVTISQIFIFRTPDQREKTTGNATSLATMKETSGGTNKDTEKHSEKDGSSSESEP